MTQSKVLLIPILFILFIGGASATMIFGTTYNQDGTQKLAGANVQVECDGRTYETISNSYGKYKVPICSQLTMERLSRNPVWFAPCMFENTVCESGSEVTVYAEKDGMTGTTSGIVKGPAQSGWGMISYNCGNDCDKPNHACDCIKGFSGNKFDVNLNNQIPEFTGFATALALFGAGAGIMIIRRSGKK